MPGNLLIPLPGFTLPPDFARRVGFVAAIDEYRAGEPTVRYEPARFFGYYFEAGAPIGVSGARTVALKNSEAWMEMRAALERLTGGQFSVNAEGGEATPEYVLVHDRWNEACWLWSFGFGRQFVAAMEAVLSADSRRRTVREGGEGPRWRDE